MIDNSTIMKHTQFIGKTKYNIIVNGESMYISGKKLQKIMCPEVDEVKESEQ